MRREVDFFLFVDAMKFWDTRYSNAIPHSRARERTERNDQSQLKVRESSAAIISTAIIFELKCAN